jgi:hypothetical protein
MQADLALLQSGRSVRHLRTVERRLKLTSRAGAVAILVATLAFGAYGFAKRQSRLDREHLLRIERAEKESRRQLWESLVAQARASRRTGESGQRFSSLDALTKAAALDPSPTSRAQALVELRHEAIAALALADVRAAPLPFLPSKATVGVDADLERYAVESADGGVQVRRLSDGELLLELPPQTHGVQWIHYFSPNGQFLPVLYEDGLLRVWDLAQREVVLSVRPEERLKSVDISPDSQRMVVVDAKRTVRLYELPTGKLLKEESPNVAWLRLRFSPDGRRMGGCSETRTAAQLIAVDTGQVMVELPHPKGVHALAWSPEGRRVATGCNDGKVYLWEPPRREPVGTFSGHQSAAVALAFHPNGRVLASSSWDGTVRLWDTASGEQLVRLEAAGYFPRFTRNGRRLIFCREEDEHALWVFDVAADPVCRLLGGASFRQTESTVVPRAQYSVNLSQDGR